MCEPYHWLKFFSVISVGNTLSQWCGHDNGGSFCVFWVATRETSNETHENQLFVFKGTWQDILMLLWRPQFLIGGKTRVGHNSEKVPLLVIQPLLFLSLLNSVLCFSRLFSCVGWPHEYSRTENVFCYSSLGYSEVHASVGNDNPTNSTRYAPQWNCPNCSLRVEIYFLNCKNCLTYATTNWLLSFVLGHQNPPPGQQYPSLCH